MSNPVVDGMLAHLQTSRMMAVWYKHGQNNYTVPGIGMAYDYNSPHTRVNAKTPASRQTLFDGAVEGQVLLKNTNGALPLKSPQMLSLFGYSGKVSLLLSDFKAVNIRKFQEQSTRNGDAHSLDEAFVSTSSPLASLPFNGGDSQVVD